jgi:hypothetical protein
MVEEIDIILIIKILTSLACLAWINFDFIRHNKEFWIAIKGDDKILQATEMCIYVWVRIFPILVICDLMFSLELSDKAWYSMDAIFFGLILGDYGHKYLNKKKSEEL